MMFVDPTMSPSQAGNGRWLWHGARPWTRVLRSVMTLMAPTVRTSRAPCDARMAQEAADVRALALHYRRSDPGFASDLLAAADRHERRGAGVA